MQDVLRSSPVIRVLVALWLSACTLDSDYRATRYRCDAAEPCPSGQSCVAGFCELSADERGACGSLGVLQDSFADLEVSDELWSDSTYNGFGLIQEGGELVFQPPPDTDGSDATYRSRRYYLLAGSQVSAEIVAVDTASEAGLALEIENVRDNWAAIRHQGGTLYMEHEIDDVHSELATVAYSETEHRFWQLREEAGTLYWETSPDRATWKTQLSVPAEPFSGLVHVYVWSYLYTAEPAPVPMRVANVNGESPSGETWCAGASLRDDFDDGAISDFWDDWTSGDCASAELGGALAITHPVDASTDCGYYSRQLYDMTSSTFTVQVAQTSDNVESLFSLWMPDDSFVEFELDAGDLFCAKKVQGDYTTAVQLPYDPAAHQWWRFRGQDGVVYWEVSGDGKSWETLASHGSPALPLDQVEIGLWGYSETGGAIAFDNVNLTP